MLIPVCGQPTATRPPPIVGAHHGTFSTTRTSATDAADAATTGDPDIRGPVARRSQPCTAAGRPHCARFAQTLVVRTTCAEALIVTMVSGGHILIESVPGPAKTTAAQTLATSVSGSFKRAMHPRPHAIRFGRHRPRLLHAAVSTQIGPITRISCCDEINRSNAKTQSAMLEAMAEGATTIGGNASRCRSRLVIATENQSRKKVRSICLKRRWTDSR